MPNARCLPLIGQAAKRHFRVAQDHAQIAVQVAILEDEALAKQARSSPPEWSRREGHWFFALNLDAVACDARPDIQRLFDQTNILVSSAEQGLDPGCKLYLYFH